MPEPKKIDEMFAWIVTEPDGGEGIPALHTASGALPMVGADRARVESLRPHAQGVAAQLGLPLRLVRFHDMEIIEQFEPKVRAGQA